MRVVYYTHSAFWEPALSIVRALSRHVELHLLVELGPDAWQSSAFDVDPRGVRPGLVPGDAVVASAFPPALRAAWRDTASFQLVVHGSRQSLHPASWRRSQEVLAFAGRVRADVLHVDDVDVSSRLPLALTQYRACPVVLSVHDPEPHSGERNWRKRLARALAFPRVSRFVLHNASQRDAFRARYRLPAGSVTAVPLGAYDIARAWAPPDVPVGERPPTVLFVGRLSRYKGLEVLHAAAPAIARAVPDVRIVIAGRPVPGYAPPPPPVLPTPAVLKHHARYVGNADLARLFGAADVVVCPYTDATQSGVILTAYGFNRPVVATRVGGLPDYVDEERTGLLVPPGNASALAAAVTRVLTEPGLRDQLSHGIRDAREGWLGWDRAAEQLLEVYADVRRAGKPGAPICLRR